MGPQNMKADRKAFTLVELLLVIAIIAVLAALLLPVLARSKEKAKVTRVHAELYGIGLALEMYSADHGNKVPPVRVNCNSDLSAHWCELPVELANEHYLTRETKVDWRPICRTFSIQAALTNMPRPDRNYSTAVRRATIRFGCRPTRRT